MAKFVTNETLQAEFSKSAKTGETIAELSARIGLKPQSVTTRVKKLRERLIEGGVKPERVAQVFPELKRSKGAGRPSSVAEFIKGILEEQEAA